MSAEGGSGGNGADDDGASRIYVGNLIPKANEVHLKTLFARFGVIHNIWVARKPPGFAFVSYESSECAKRAVEAFEMVKDGEYAMEILGKPVKVQMAGEKDKKAKTNEEPTQPDQDTKSGWGHKNTSSKHKKSAEKPRAAKRTEKNGSDRSHCYSHERQRQRSQNPIKSSNSSSGDETRKRRSRPFASSSRGSRRRRSRSKSWSCRRSRSVSRDSRGRRRLKHERSRSRDRRSRSPSRTKPRRRRYNSNSRSRSRSRRSSSRSRHSCRGRRHSRSDYSRSASRS